MDALVILLLIIILVVLITFRNYVTGYTATHNLDKSPGSENNRFLLWAIMAAIFFILCFFTFKMIREVNKKAADNQ